MAKTIRFFLVIEDKQEEQARAIAAIEKVFPPQGEATNFGSYERAGYWWRHTEDETSLTVMWIAKTMSGFREMLQIALAQIKLGVVKREDVLVLTDLMFPIVEGRGDMPNGVSVVLAATKEDLVVAVCTDTNHHDAQFFQDLHPLLSEKAAYDSPYGVDAKDWDKAVSEIRRVQAYFKDL